MCIIAYKPQGIEKISNNRIKAMFNNNSDGAGLMYPINDKIYIKKGLMTYQEFKKEYDKIKNIKDVPLLLHFRIATHGGTNREMTQPFPLSSNIAELQALELYSNIGIAHNGIIALTSYATNISDTAEFIKRYCTKLIKNDIIDCDILDVIESSISGSRLAIMTRNGNVYLLGDWMQVDGVYYSNESYIDYSKRAKQKQIDCLSGYISDYNLPGLYCDGLCNNCNYAELCNY